MRGGVPLQQHAALEGIAGDEPNEANRPANLHGFERSIDVFPADRFDHMIDPFPASEPHHFRGDVGGGFVVDRVGGAGFARSIQFLVTAGGDDRNPAERQDKLQREQGHAASAVDQYRE